MSGFFSIYTANPTSTITRPADTTAYAQNDFISTSTTAASCTAASIEAARKSLNGGTITRVRLYTNVTTGWDASTFNIRLWSTSPTYTGGDNAAYAITTGAAYWMGTFAATLFQATDGCYGAGVPAIGNGLVFALPASQTALYWDLQYTGSSALTPISGQTFTLALEVFQS